MMMKRWAKPNGYRQVLSVSLPLAASMGSLTLMQFTDRVFLANYSVDAISAVLPAGIAAFACISFFKGAANYTNAFVAQYIGARAFNRVGAAVWQGIYFSLIASCLLAAFYFISEPLFNLIGHSPGIKSLEITYFKILILGAGFDVFNSTLSCFYTGRGLAKPVMLVHLAGAILNIPFDYCLINGIGPFPELGMFGAGIATISAHATITIIFCLLVFNRRNRTKFGTWENRSFDKVLFGRLMRFGLPSGIQFFLEIFGFAFFFQMLGRLGDLSLAASNIVLSIESISFMPMVGFHIGNATLVGQAIGRGRPEDGVYATTSALHLTVVYMFLVAGLFVFAPEPLLHLFVSNPDAQARYAEIMDLGVKLLRFVAVFCFFDAMNLVYSGAIKGAGDTRFIMWTIAALSVGMMIIPIYVAIEVIGAGLYTAWVILTIYICVLGVAFMLRYRSGKWKKMCVIETLRDVSSH